MTSHQVCLLNSYIFPVDNSISSFIILDGVTGGVAYVYSVNNNEGTVNFEQELSKNSTRAGSSFGSSVSINGDYIVVGAPKNGDGGAAYIFHKDSNEWDLFSPSPTMNAFFGWSVAVNSNGVIAVGAWGDRESKGSVYIFKYDGETTWNHVFTLQPNVSDDGSSGWDVAIDEE